MSENVKMIFKRALNHYIKVLEKLRVDKGLEFSNDIFREDIQNNINTIDEMMKGLDSIDAMASIDKNRKLMCCSLENYISDLEKIKNKFTSKLQDTDASLPTIGFTKVNDELELARRIQTTSCIDHGF